MKHCLFIIVLFFSATLYAQQKDFSGKWKGKIDSGVTRLSLELNLQKGGNDVYTGSLTIPEQGVSNMSFNSVSVNNEKITAFINTLQGTFRGYLINDSTIKGVWQRGMTQLPLQMKKTANLTEKKDEYELTIPIPGGTLSGTLRIHDNSQPLAIIIAGSGPTDRDGNNPIIGKPEMYKKLTDELFLQGIASFRYDKRGIGKSVLKNTNENSVIFSDFVNDAVVVFNYLKDSLNVKNIYFVGHSEGSLIGMVASQKCIVKGFISISGAGSPADQIIDTQIKENKNNPAYITTQAEEILKALKEGKHVDSVPAYFNSLFRPSIQPYLISWFKYDPAKEIAKLKIPVLIEQGTCDIQIKEQDALILHKASPQSKLNIIPNMTHTLKDAGANCDDKDLKTYKDGTLPVNPQLAKDIVRFIEKR